MHRKAMKRSGNPLQLRKGAWDSQEDNLLRKCIEKYGEGKWHLVSNRSGLNRCRKSCRLRWLNYLRPTIKRGEFSEAEVDLMMRLHRLLGNRWSLIAGRLPGRTGNDVKNFWNTSLRAKLTPAEVVKKASTVKAEELIQTKDDNNTKTSSAKSDHVVITPLPRTFSKGTNVSIKYSPPCPQEIMYNNGNNMSLLSQNPPATLPLDYDSIKWWNTLLGEELGIDGQEEEPGEEVEEWLDLDAQRGLIWNTNESFDPATEAMDLLKEDSQTNGWSDDIWDFLNDDYN